MEWRFRRNCSLTPRQLGTAYAFLSGASLCVAAFFWLTGAPFILPFAALELVAVGVAFLVYARHATDGERVLLEGGRLIVEWESAGKVCREVFVREFVRVEPNESGDRLIEVREGARRASLGRYVRADLRPVLVRELRQAIRGV
jgi:uncharacterized membrane protein